MLQRVKIIINQPHPACFMSVCQVLAQYLNKMIGTYLVLEFVNPESSEMMNESDLNTLHTLIREGWNIKHIKNWSDKVGDHTSKGYALDLERFIPNIKDDE